MNAFVASLLTSFYFGLLALGLGMGGSGLLADGSADWMGTTLAVILAVFAGAGPGLIAGLLAWLRAGSAHQVIQDIRKTLASLLKIQRRNRDTLESQTRLLQRLEAFLARQEAKDVPKD